MQLNDITLKDKELFEKMSGKSGVAAHFSGFVNLYLWKNIEKIKYFIYNHKLFVTGISPETPKRYFLFPDASTIKKDDILFLKEEFKEEWSVTGLSKGEAERLEKECGGLISVFHERNMDNYIYLTENLINLSGKKYHSKKNHLNSFKKNYSYEYVSYDKSKRDEVTEFLGKWYFEKNEKDMLLEEANSIVNGIDNYEELGLKGGLIKVDGRVVAFTMGEQMTDEMAVIHFEKADTDYAGAYAAINNEFLKNEWSAVKYVNREEDMGLEGLRKSKLSYKPEILFEVYSAELK